MEFILKRKQDSSKPSQTGVLLLFTSEKRKSELSGIILPHLKKLSEYSTEHLISIGIKKSDKGYKVKYVRDVTLIEKSNEKECYCSFNWVVNQAHSNNCSGIVIAHNHPDTEILFSSLEDNNFTESLDKFCSEFNLRLYDSVIVGKSECTQNYYSFWERYKLHKDEEVQ